MFHECSVKFYICGNLQYIYLFHRMVNVKIQYIVFWLPDQVGSDTIAASFVDIYFSEISWPLFRLM
jgi:hypothetical protein